MSSGAVGAGGRSSPERARSPPGAAAAYGSGQYVKHIQPTCNVTYQIDPDVFPEVQRKLPVIREIVKMVSAHLDHRERPVKYLLDRDTNDSYPAIITSNKNQNEIVVFFNSCASKTAKADVASLISFMTVKAKFEMGIEFDLSALQSKSGKGLVQRVSLDVSFGFLQECDDDEFKSGMR